MLVVLTAGNLTGRVEGRSAVRQNNGRFSTDGNIKIITTLAYALYEYAHHKHTVCIYTIVTCIHVHFMSWIDLGNRFITFVFHVIIILNKNTLGVKKVRGQSEATLQTVATKNFDIS